MQWLMQHSDSVLWLSLALGLSDPYSIDLSINIVLRLVRVAVLSFLSREYQA